MLLRRISALAILTLALGGAVAEAAPKFSPSQAVAQKQSPQRGPDRGQALWLRELNLSAEQMQKMQEIRDRYKNDFDRRRQALSQAQSELRDLMAGTASQSQIRSKHRQVLQLRQQLAELQFESTLAMREILTPEQRRKMAERMAKRWENSRKGPGNGRGEQGEPDREF